MSTLNLKYIMVREEIKNIQDFFNLAKGSVHVAAYLNLNQYTVDRWHRTGIPEKHYVLLSDKYNISIAELKHISDKAQRVAKRR